jgi:protease-4
MGPSRQPPVDIPIPVPLLSGAVAGEETIVQLLRKAERDDRLAALIFHIDSGGGVALASDLIWRQIQRIVKKKPVIAYFGNIAASGGYYVGASARKIIAQSTSITGSIGVVIAHLSTGDLYNKLGINRVSLSRGERALLHSEATPLTSEEHEVLWDSITDTYRKFKEVVADGRDLPIEQLDSICEGRVWTGRQAQNHGLVDDLGDFIEATKKAAELASLPDDEQQTIPVVNLYPQDRQYILPKPFELSEEIARILSLENLHQISGKPLLLMPFRIKFW